MESAELDGQGAQVLLLFQNLVQSLGRPFIVEMAMVQCDMRDGPSIDEPLSNGTE